MHPYYTPGFYPWHRAPRRIVWFFLGAAAATLWIKQKEARTHGHYLKNSCIRPPLQRPPALESAEAAPQWIPRAINNMPPASSGDPQRNQSKSWDEEMQRVTALTNQATDKMTELSETTLDTVLTTVATLKAKLAEHRAEREKQQSLLEQQMEEQHKQPPRLV